jgi:AcrR family transcriptional regulator
MRSAAQSAAPARLPPGRHGLERAFVISNQRERILDAMASEVADKGYAAVTVKDVHARAGVSSTTFYELFSDKADCFLAAYDAAIETLMGRVRTAFEALPEPTPAQGRAVLGAILEAFAAEPDFARMCIVEVNAAGPEAMTRYVGVVERFMGFVDQIERYPETKRHRGPKPDPVMRKALVGGIAWVIHDRIVAGETEKLPELLPQLAYFLFAPFIGDQQAAAAAFGE